MSTERFWRRKDAAFSVYIYRLIIGWKSWDWEVKLMAIVVIDNQDMSCWEQLTLENVTKLADCLMNVLVYWI